ncbi:hypothetical protein C8R47DRAFT_1227053 [Mycena vitilis]|nr:hypothetical protein C8R47DRAFT_1227053 [Mycena vitilis]
MPPLLDDPDEDVDREEIEHVFPRRLPLPRRPRPPLLFSSQFFALSAVFRRLPPLPLFKPLLPCFSLAPLALVPALSPGTDSFPFASTVTIFRGFDYSFGFRLASLVVPPSFCPSFVVNLMLLPYPLGSVLLYRPLALFRPPPPSRHA